MRNHILEVLIVFSIAIGMGIGAGVTITLLSGPTIHSTPVSISLNIDEVISNYDAEKSEREWQEQFGGMSDEERMFGIVGEPEIIEHEQGSESQLFELQDQDWHICSRSVKND